MTLPAQLSAADWDEYHRAGRGCMVTDLERERFLSLAPAPLDRRVVDIGCGGGRWTRQLAQWGAHVTGYDYSPEALAQACAHAAAGPSYEQWDVNGGPIPTSLTPGTVDLVTCRLSLAYLDIARFLGDVTRWLAPDGALSILTPVKDDRLDAPRQPPTDEDPYLRALPQSQLNCLRADSQWKRHQLNATGGRFAALVLQGPAA
ncbi:class I SAM-dependent methyltransferase [Streptomyces longispororuber]|uniref:class I SAM-dependent methyltransferase n=1 Tax=Streptomyces longispororuber TaxID=68230 RepID=UPI0033DC0435